jgi:hypothetical protein
MAQPIVRPRVIAKAPNQKPNLAPRKTANTLAGTGRKTSLLNKATPTKKTYVDLVSLAHETPGTSPTIANGSIGTANMQAKKNNAVFHIERTFIAEEQESATNYS